MLKDVVSESMKVLMNNYDQWKDAFDRTNTASNKDFAQIVDKVTVSMTKVDSNLKQLAQVLDTFAPLNSTSLHALVSRCCRCTLCIIRFWLC